MGLAVINAVWIGPSLGRIHAACLRSFVEAGHRVLLHCYTVPEDVPDGVEIADAARLIPPDRVFLHAKTGSYSTFSNQLRYRILTQELGLYVDCDMHCIRPIEDADYIFGWQDDNTINGAVLKLPSGCPALKALDGIDDEFIPPWLPARQRRKLRLRRLVGRSRGLGALPWGSLGPTAITWYLKRHGLEAKALPIDTFYPVPHTHVSQFLDPDLTLDDLTTKRTVAVHLWNEVLRRVTPGDIPPMSPLASIIVCRDA